MITFIRIYAALIAALLIAGETWVVITTNKYWPLSLDDYIACACLIASAALIKKAQQLPWLIGIWMFMFGNIYAMLFNRLDPVSGTGERINILIGLLVIISVGIASTTYSWFRANKAATN